MFIVNAETIKKIISERPIFELNDVRAI